MQTVYVHVLDIYIKAWSAPSLVKGSLTEYELTAPSMHVIVPGEHININLNFCLSCSEHLLIKYKLTNRMQKDGAILTEDLDTVIADVKTQPLDLAIRNVGSDYIVIKPGNKIGKMLLSPTKEEYKLIVGT